MKPVKESKVFEKELQDIAARRKVVADAYANSVVVDPKDVKKDLVGLCLSGGGMRSASFSIGMLQQLGESGFLRFVDYLSTVSGGGYTGAILTASAFGAGNLAKNPALTKFEQLRQAIRRFSETLSAVGGDIGTADSGQLAKELESTRTLLEHLGQESSRFASVLRQEHNELAKALDSISRIEHLRDVICPFSEKPSVASDKADPSNYENARAAGHGASPDGAKWSSERKLCGELASTSEQVQHLRWVICCFSKRSSAVDENARAAQTGAGPAADLPAPDCGASSFDIGAKEGKDLAKALDSTRERIEHLTQAIRLHVAGSADQGHDIVAGQQSDLVRRLTYGGDYLFRDNFAFAARYCAGFVLNNVFFLSGVIFVAAAIAILWRAFDAPYLRGVLADLDSTHVFDCDRISGALGSAIISAPVSVMRWISKRAEFKWNSDSVCPFLPGLMLLMLWLVLLLLKLLYEISDYVCPTWLSDHRKLRQARANDKPLEPLPQPSGVAADSWWPWCGGAVILLCVLLLGLYTNGLTRCLTVIGFLEPDPRNPDARHWTATAFGVLLLIGLLTITPLQRLIWFAIRRPQQLTLALILPAFLVGLVVWLGNRDVTDTSSVWNLKESLIPWGALAAMLSPFLRPNLVIESAIAPKNTAQRLMFLVASAALLMGAPLFFIFWIAREDFAEEASRRTVLTAGDFIGLPNVQATFEQFKNQAQADARQAYGSDKEFSQSFATLLRGAAALSSRRDASLEAFIQEWNDANQLSVPKAAVPSHLTAVRNLGPQAFIEAVKNRYNAQMSAWQLRSKPTQERFDDYFTLFLDDELPELIAKCHTLDGSDPTIVPQLNRGLLTAWYPGFIHARAMVPTATAIQPDQRARGRLLVWALGVFVVSGLLIDPNRTSIQQFYCSCISNTFVAFNRRELATAGLHEIDTTSRGAPYHLISGTVNFLGAVGPDVVQRQEMYLFSRRFCGSRTLHYAETQQTLPANYNTLSNAVAVSGAAVSPVIIRQPLLFAVMMVLNLRLGQWLPNPNHKVWPLLPKVWATVPRLLWVFQGLATDATKRGLCFVSDGGHRENLGLAQLLLRKTKLIIAVDCGQDPTHQFDDLARVLRHATIHMGAKLLEIDTEGRLTGRELQSDELDLRTTEHAFQAKTAEQTSPVEKSRQESTKRIESGMTGQHYLLARIVYHGAPEDDFNLLVYVKPSLTGDENEIIEQYRARHPEFPHEPTSDQHYSAAQFVAYRELGEHIAKDLAQRLSPVTDDENWWNCVRPTSADDLIDAFLERQWALKKPTRLEDDYAHQLMLGVLDRDRTLSDRLELAGILRRLHPHARLLRDVRRLSEGLRTYSSPSAAPGQHECEIHKIRELLRELGSLTILPVLAMLRCRRSSEELVHRECLDVLEFALLGSTGDGPHAKELLGRAVRELERLLRRSDIAVGLRNKIHSLLRRLAERDERLMNRTTVSDASSRFNRYVGIKDLVFRPRSAKAPTSTTEESSKHYVYTLYDGGELVYIGGMVSTCNGCDTEMTFAEWLSTSSSPFPTWTSCKLEEIKAEDAKTGERQKRLLEEYKQFFLELPRHHRD